MQVNENTFDYIIVGSGPAGSVLANRLSADGRAVLVLEAGPNRNDDPAIVNYNGGAMGKTSEYMWNTTTVSSRNLKGQTMITGSGRLAGGGSSVNGQVYVRPTPYVLEQWEKLAGPQWSPDKVNSRFRKLEKFNGPHAEPSAHGTEGRLDIRQTFPAGGALLEKLSTALAKATGHAIINDYNDPSTPIGSYQRLQVFQNPEGKRASSSVAFLGEDIVDKSGKGTGHPSLQIFYEATASKVLFDDGKRATSVEYIHQGKTAVAHANKKVILSAGLRSSKILQQSGIGPRSVLEEAGIEIVHESPKVGQTNVTDSYGRAIFMVNTDDAAALKDADIGTYWRSGAFLPSSLPGSRQDKRQIQVLFMNIGNNMVMAIILDIDPKSYGNIKVQSTDPLKTMRLDQNLLSDPADMEEMKTTLRTYIKGMGDALAELDPTYRLVSPPPDELSDDAKLEDYIRTNFGQNFHDQCALAMGTASDAAVNGWCEVNGVHDLLVCDASVIPYHADGNPSASSYVIGETIAAHLLDEE